MTQPILNSPCIVSGVRQRVATPVAEHVCVHLEVEATALANALDKPIDGVRSERSATLGREDKAAIRKLPV